MSNEQEKVGNFLRVFADVRYWEDATVNGVEDHGGGLIPLRQGNSWCPVIDLENGSIVNWTKGVVADVHYKICDAGKYYLTDRLGATTHKRENDYVPSEYLCFGGEGYGDYIIMKIDGDGKIEGYKRPQFRKDEWEEC